MLRPILLLMVLAVFVLLVPQAEGRSPGFMFEAYTGKASYYSDNLHGKATASGERYNKNALTAAHRSLPLGTIVRVTNLANGRSQILRVNDRGPLKQDWILDISREGAKRLGMLNRGVTSIQLEVIGNRRGEPSHAGTAFYLTLSEAPSSKAAHRNLRDLVQHSTRAAQLGLSKRETKRAKQHLNDAQVFISQKAQNKRLHFVGLGPYFRYKEAVSALKAITPLHPKTQLVCRPATMPVQEWERIIHKEIK